MKPSEINEVLDIAYTARKNGDNFYPLFVGPPGIAKSSVIQAWSNKKGLPFIDLRLAYLEPPDMVGFPDKEMVNGRQRMVYTLPEFWPTEGEGVILLEEPNRGTSAMMNTVMQLLTDRKVHGYTLPPGWLIVGAINPENEQHDVNTMDAALKNRFVTFEVEYNKADFVKYMTAEKWDRRVVDFIETNNWQYLAPERVGNDNGARYISPRTWHQVNSALKAGLAGSNELLFYTSILGYNVGKAFYSFLNQDRPVFYSELVGKKTSKAAWETLKEHAHPDKIKNSHLAVLVKDILLQEELDKDVLFKVLTILPSDLAFNLMTTLNHEKESFFDELLKEHPDLKKQFKGLSVGDKK